MRETSKRINVPLYDLIKRFGNRPVWRNEWGNENLLKREFEQQSIGEEPGMGLLKVGCIISAKLTMVFFDSQDFKP